ncbi:pro-FMRFamide-related neuropeptide FF [Dryobates pubescens]|uniref:pro-FMRFamide-related neuropeptide FF n=1 Tax=Dryobates pubescens TaxID=118200 RepID=UPI0023B971B8|nr:pro-FMRFamide-related neuropeptide FF [Dryobates pubescens]
MEGRRLLLLLLLLGLGGVLRTSRCCPGTLDPGTGPGTDPELAPPPPAAAALDALLRSLQRSGRGTGTLLQPPRSGRGSQWGPQPRLSPRSWDPSAAPFWTMATPQRFGRRR